MSPMTGTMRTAIMAQAEGDSTLLQMLGSKSKESIFPRPGKTAPGADPWIVFQMMSDTAIDDIVNSSGFRVRVYDDPGQGYSRIDRILGRLKQIYQSGKSVVYSDAGGQAFRQRLAFQSEDGYDDGYIRNTRWIEWQLWRVAP